VRPDDGRITTAWLRTLDAGGAELARRPVAASADPGPVVAVATDSPAADGGSLVVGADPGWLAAGVTVAEPDGHVESVEVRWMIRAREGQLDVIGPGFGYRLYEFPDTTAWLQEDVSARLTADLEGLQPFAPVRHTGPRD
jgi:hypothetical protein